MNSPGRPVDHAMAEGRPPKQAVRKLWVERVRQAANDVPNPSEPWYLTLSGAEGRDIQLLVHAGLISITEVGSVALEDQDKIVAVEPNNAAIVSLQARFPGLRIKEVPFQDLVRGESPFTWPQGDDEKYCRAYVINLDLNAPLSARYDQGDVVFPVLTWVRKLCMIHSRPPRLNWTLCLTLHGALVWPAPINEWMRNFLTENLQREASFATDCERILGARLLSSALQEPVLDFTSLAWPEQQKLVMVIAPKTLANLVHIDGWRVETLWNLRYGGGRHAPMVTWIMQFEREEGAGATPDAIYRHALRKLLSGAGSITKDGEVRRIE